MALSEVEPKTVWTYRAAIATGLGGEVDFVTSASGGYADADSLMLVVDARRFRIDEVRRYERRRPEKTPLHKIIFENLASWLEWRDVAERPVPGYVEEELRGYLRCGILCFSLRSCPLHGLRPDE
ncbi:MAG: hypothetical protein ACKO4T_02045 [Planctomycetaceae bacterium]